MNQNSLVSIIIPVYNCELYIGECINKVLLQTYENLQLIIVDDGSTDDSYKICKEIDDNRIILIKKQNGGASSARNLGLKYATGDYIYFVDSDDYLAENAIEILVNTAEAVQADCVFFEAENFSVDNSIKYKKNGLLHKREYPIMSGKQLISVLLENKDYHASPVIYFTHCSVFSDDLRFEEGIMFEDELFSFRMLQRCKRIISIKQPLYFRRVRAESVTTLTGKEQYRFSSMSKVFMCIFDMYKNNADEIVLKLYMARIGHLWIGYWEKMSKKTKDMNCNQYKNIKTLILDEKGFGNKELILRCHNNFLWNIYRIPNRCIKLIKGSNKT